MFELFLSNPLFAILALIGLAASLLAFGLAQTQGKTTFGTLIKIGDGASPEVFTTISEVYSISPVGSTVELVDFTHHESPGGQAEYKPSGVQEGDEITCQANEVPGNASQNLVRTAFDNGSTDNWQVVFANGATEQFAAIVTHVDTDPSDIRGKQVFNFTIKIAGNITRTDP